MNCYYCELEGGPGGTRHGIRQAVGVCADCGAGVCLEHAHFETPGEPLRCPEHTPADITAAERLVVPVSGTAARSRSWDLAAVPS